MHCVPHRMTYRLTTGIDGGLQRDYKPLINTAPCGMSLRLSAGKLVCALFDSSGRISREVSIFRLSQASPRTNILHVSFNATVVFLERNSNKNIIQENIPIKKD